MTTMDLPRSLEQRVSDARSKLEARHADAWVASASASGTPHLVPLSFAWNGAQLIVVTEKTAVTTRNIIATARARVGLGSTRDVVMVDVVFDRDIPVGEAPDHFSEQYAHQADWDPRSAGGEFTFLLLRPVRIQVWREANEIEGRTVLRNGTWLV